MKWIAGALYLSLVLLWFALCSFACPNLSSVQDAARAMLYDTSGESAPRSVWRVESFLRL